MDCLVTRLKSQVNDSSLVKLGGIQFTLKEGTSNALITPIPNETLPFEVIKGNVTLSQYQGAGISLPADLEYNDSWRTLTSVGESVIEIGNKYNAMDLGAIFLLCKPKDIVELDYMYNLETINQNRAASSICGIVGDCKHLVKFPKLKRIHWNNSLCYGNISELGKLNGLVELQFLTSMVTGSLEEFVLNARSVGRTSGSVILGWLNDTGVTFNGETITKKEESKLEWTANTITWDGTTISA